MSNSNLQRVFIHELGHFVAKEITYQQFGIRKAASIKFEYHPMYDDYTGEIVPITPPGEDSFVPTINRPEKFVDLVYGCMFEAYYLERDFLLCFSEKGHGHVDLDMWAGEVHNLPKWKSRDELKSLEEEHFEELVRLQALQEFCELRVEDFILATEGNFVEIDLQKLSKAVEPFIEKFKPIFLEYLEKVREVCAGKPLAQQ